MEKNTKKKSLKTLDGCSEVPSFAFFVSILIIKTKQAYSTQCMSRSANLLPLHFRKSPLSLTFLKKLVDKVLK